MGHLGHKSIMSIPSKIFFYWDGPNMSSTYERNIEHVRILNSDWDVKVVDDNFCLPILEKNFPEYVSLYKKIVIPAAKSDIMRLALLYEYGGWYIDCDMRPRVTLDYWDYSNKSLYLFWVLNGKKKALSNNFIGAAPGHPFMKKALKIIFSFLEKRFFINSVYNSTGPNAVFCAIGSYVHDRATEFQEMDYSVIDVIGDNTKGSWTYQENCGIWHDEQNPPVFYPHVSLDRIESLDAFHYYCKTFDKYPENRAENYGKLLQRAGVHYLHKHNLIQEISELTEEFLPYIKDKEYFKRLADKYKEKGCRDLARKFYRIYEA